MSSKLEPAIWSRGAGQQIPCFDRCQLTITWMANIKDVCCILFGDKYTSHICYSPAGRSLLGKTVPEVSSTEGTVFPNTDQPRPVNNIFIYF